MEAGWERTVAVPTVPHDAVHASLESWLDGRTLRAATVMSGGLVNLNLRIEVESDAAPVVLRARLRQPEQIAVEAAVLRRVASLVPAPRVLHEGVLATDDGSWPFLLLSYRPGDALSAVLHERDGPPTARAGEEVGAALARLHSAGAMPAAGFFDADLALTTPMPSIGDAWQAYVVEGLDGRAGQRLGPRAPALRSLVEREVERIAPLEDAAVLLHGDAKPTNVRVDEAGALTGLLDWEFAWAGPALFDIGQMLRWPVPPAFESGFLHSYQAVAGQLPPDWRHLARLLDLVNLVGFLSRDAHQPNRDRDVLRLIDRYLRLA